MEQHTHTPSEYRQHAENCRKLAASNLSEAHRARLLAMAETCARLANSQQANSQSAQTLYGH